MWKIFLLRLSVTWTLVERNITALQGKEDVFVLDARSGFCETLWFSLSKYHLMNTAQFQLCLERMTLGIN